jgi:hypothetical protein
MWTDCKLEGIILEICCESLNARISVPNNSPEAMTDMFISRILALNTSMVLLQVGPLCEPLFSLVPGLYLCCCDVS